MDRVWYRFTSWMERRRIARLRRLFRTIGDHVLLSDGFFCDRPDRAILGNHIYIGPGAIFTTRGGLRIDDGAIFGPRCRILTANHQYVSSEAAPYDGRVVLRPVHVECGVWVGADVLIVPGVRIGAGAVVAAGSVVVKDIDPCTIAGGNPCRAIKQRDAAAFERLRAEQRWYLKLKRSGQIRDEEIGSADVARFLGEH